MFTEFNIFILFMSFGTSIIIIIDLLRNKTKILENTLEYFLGPVYRPYEKNGIMGATYMLIGFMIISIIMNKIPAIFGMFVVIFSDSASALIGIRYGKIYLVNNVLGLEWCSRSSNSQSSLSEPILVNNKLGIQCIFKSDL